jgi:hypothetical protein
MAWFQQDSLLSWQSVGIQVLLVFIGVIVYRHSLSPCSGIPGPFLASCSRFWHIGRILAGDQNTALIQLHDKHGMISSIILGLRCVDRLWSRSFRPNCT